MKYISIENLYKWYSLNELLNLKSFISIVLAYFIPLFFGLLFGIFRLRRRRMCETDCVRIAPLILFFSLLTDGANLNNEKLMNLLHPTLLEEGIVERGILQAVARCLHDKFGKLVGLSDMAIRISRSGRQTNCEGFIDFEYTKQVWCKLSWVWRPTHSKGPKRKPREEPGATGSSVNGIDSAFLDAFYVTAFYVNPKEEDCLDVEKYVNLDNFNPFAERFVKRIFEKPPTEAMMMMMPALQKTHFENDVNKLQEEIQHVVSNCGGLPHDGELTNRVDVTLIERKTITSMPKIRNTESVERDTSAMEDSMAILKSIEILYLVGGGMCDIEVSVRFNFYGLHCVVTQYEVRQKKNIPSNNVLD
ncbi:unnamed protein product [Phytomonas sp. Hart1]|nr:unnamed protein product [Phytomonas sp. Hart1]|eukprot:CCW70998.1 unnamed protein product [Phytomonas sp. isolate Hart1]